jgi:hypothetical protein
MKLLEKLQLVQSQLKAPKNQRNTFGNYNYRSCEDILEAVKPLLKEQQLTLTISDDVINIGNRYYVMATVTLTDGEEKEIVKAFARESETKKGMDESQITGACSSYARKYALNGLFLIDDTKDADSMDNNEQKKDIKVDVKADKRKETIIDLCKKLGFTGETAKEYNVFVFSKTTHVLKEENFDLIIEKLNKLIK